MPQRKLALRKETLAELTEQELGQLAGGVSGPSCNTFLCITKDTACYSDFAQCTGTSGWCPTGYGC